MGGGGAAAIKGAAGNFMGKNIPNSLAYGASQAKDLFNYAKGANSWGAVGGQAKNAWNSMNGWQRAGFAGTYAGAAGAGAAAADFLNPWGLGFGD
jgi:hypothetical protein